MAARIRTRARARLRHAFPPPKGTKIGFAVAAALAGVATPDPPALAATPTDTSGGALQEVVVTARKREENLQDVPISIDVLTRKDLQNLGIVQLEDYMYKVPSLSFISIGPGTQTFYMRGVSDGSDPNFANASATGFFLDDSSLSWFASQPDLHLYDIERIEVLNGPQGTTFGAGSMSGAIRYVTNKPDVNAFSAGADFDTGKIHGGQENWSYEAFLNAPLIQGRLGLRVSAFSASHGGFINDLTTTRNWVNGNTSNNAPWTRNDFNRQHQEGGRVALKAVFSESWSAIASYDYQRQSALGAWDESLSTYGPRTVSRFGPEFLGYEARIGGLHVDGDVGIADLVFASTYWALPTRRWDEYSQYVENLSRPDKGLPAGFKESFACDTGPHLGAPTEQFSGCNVPIQYYEYHTNAERWSDELRLASKPGGRFHWLAGVYWEKTVDKNSGDEFFMPGMKTTGTAFQYYNAYYGTPLGSSSLPAGEIYAYQTRSDYKETTEFANISFDATNKLNFEAGVVHFHSDFSYYSPFGQFAYGAVTPTLLVGSSHKWDSKLGVSYKAAERVMVYADFAQGFRDGGSNSGDPAYCYANGVPLNYLPDTLNNFEIGWKSRSLGGRLLWNSAAYLMNWRDLQTLISDLNICAFSAFNANVGKARIYGVESNVDYRLNDNWSLQAAASYNDSHLISSAYAAFQGNVGERLPFVSYFNYSANLRFQQPVGASLHAYAQFDIAHKGDMWNDLHVAGTRGFPRVLQPAYTLMNLRFGLNPAGGRWMAELYITNLADKNGILYTNTRNFDVRQTTNEPRVFGLRVNYRFGKETNSE